MIYNVRTLNIILKIFADALFQHIFGESERDFCDIV